MGKNIGIVTFHNVLNYGAFLQAFALKTFLESNGNEVKFVNYESEGLSSEYCLINKRVYEKCTLRGKLSLVIKAVLSSTRFYKRKRKMRKLSRAYLKVLEHPTSNIKELEKEKYELIIYGSDQIWRKSETNVGGGFDPIYWGEGFDGVKKVTYAPSMGVMHFDNKDTNFIERHLKNFEYISCREGELKEELSKYSKKNIIQVLDPVFLLSEDEWEKFLIDDKKTTSDYVLIYNLMHSKSVVSLAERVATKFNLKIIEVSGSINPYCFKNNCLQTLDTFEFISTIRNAKFVVTSSFHAVAFSLIFKVNFYALGFKNNSGRVKSILKEYALNDRLVDEDFSGEISGINYSGKEISNQIKESKQFLLNAIN